MPAFDVSFSVPWIALGIGCIIALGVLLMCCTGGRKSDTSLRDSELTTSPHNEWADINTPELYAMLQHLYLIRCNIRINYPGLADDRQRIISMLENAPQLTPYMRRKSDVEQVP